MGQMAYPAEPSDNENEFEPRHDDEGDGCNTAVRVWAMMIFLVVERPGIGALPFGEDWEEMTVDCQSWSQVGSVRGSKTKRGREM